MTGGDVTLSGADGGSRGSSTEERSIDGRAHCFEAVTV
jgi:hypothetical protein